MVERQETKTSIRDEIKQFLTSSNSARKNFQERISEFQKRIAGGEEEDSVTNLLISTTLSELEAKGEIIGANLESFFQRAWIKINHKEAIWRKVQDRVSKCVGQEVFAKILTPESKFNKWIWRWGKIQKPELKFLYLDHGYSDLFIQTDGQLYFPQTAERPTKLLGDMPVREEIFAIGTDEMERLGGEDRKALEIFRNYKY